VQIKENNMNTKYVISSVAIISALLGFTLNGVARTGETPTSAGVTLSSLLEKVEAEQIGVIMEAEHEHGKWEIESCKSDACTDIKFDAVTGAELKRKTEKSDDALPPEGAKPLSAVVKTFEEHQYPISEIEFEDGVWEVYWTKDGRKVKSYLDPITAKNVTK
jgi:Peptidase propeptide and YPEB domain